MRNLFVGDPHFNDVVLCMPLRSSLCDESKYRRAIGVSGNTVVINDAAYFDGNGDYLSLSDDLAASELGGGDFTLEAWIKLTGYSTGYNGYYKSTIFSRDLFNNRAFVLNLTGTASSWTGLELTLFADNTTGYTGHSASYTFALNQWYHVAAMRRSGVVTLYVNGIPILTEANTRVIQNISSAWLIGRTEFSGYEYYFPGYIRDLRLTKVARYALNFIPPASLPTHGVPKLNRRVPVALPEAKRPPFLTRRPALSSGDPYFDKVSLLLPFSNNTVDYSKYKHTCTASGAVISAESLYSDGVYDYVTVPTSALEFGTQDFTIEFLVSILTNSDAYPQVFSSSSYLNGGFYCTVRGASTGWGGAGYLYFSFGNTVTNAPSELISKTVIRNGGWKHVAITRQGLVMRLFVNGILESQTVAPGNFSLTTSHTPKVFGAADQTISSDTGYMRQLRVTKGVARYVDNFAPSTWVSKHVTHGVPNLTTRIPTYMKSESARAPVMARRTEQSGDPYFNNVVLHLPLQTNYRDASILRRTVTQNGTVGPYIGPQYVPPQLASIAQGAGYFNGQAAGAGNWLSVAGVALDAGDFTVECWARTSGAFTLAVPIFECRNADADANGFVFYYRSTARLTVGGGSPFVATEGTTALSTTTWYHVALVRRGNTLYGYLNGKLELTRDWSASLTRTTWYVGRDAAGNDTADNYVCDLRVTKGVARYASDFTPPTRLYPTHGVAAPFERLVLSPTVSTALSNVYLEALLGWHMAGSVYREASANWNALTAALRGAVQQWHLVNAAQRDATSQWNTIAAALRDASLNWHAAGTVLRAAGFDWGLLNTQERTLNAEWHLVNAALKEAQLDWTKVGYAQADGQLDWHKVGYALRDAQIDWHAVVDVLRSADVNWHLVNAAERDMDNDWHTVAAAMREAVSQWDMGGVVFRNAQLDWNSLSTTDRQAFLEWHRLTTTQGDAALAWGLCIAAARSSSFAWHLLLAIERERALNWNKIGYTLRDAGLDWSMLEPFIHEGQIDWNLANSAEAQAELAWGMVQAMLRDEELRWHVTQGATADAETAWNLITHASRDFTAHWELIGKIVASMDATWDVVMGVSRDSEAAWNVAIAAAQQLEAAWNRLGIAAKDATVQWEKVGYTDRGIEVAWKLIPLYGTDGPPEYTVLITAEHRTVPIDFESRIRAVSPELRTLMVPPAEDDTYGKL